MQILLTFLIAAARAAEPTPQEPTGQTLTAQTLVDLDNGFTLSLDSTDWQVWEEARARGILADAVAGAMAKNGHFGVVLVEGSVGDLAETNQMLVSQLGGVTHEVSRDEQVYQGQPAIRTVLDIDAEGVQIRQLRTVFIWDDHLYQVICNGPPTSANRCGEFLDAFTLNHTSVHLRARAATPDGETRAWRLHDGLFESAVNGFSVRAPEGWRVMVGDELHAVNQGAEVGFARAQGGAYAILIPERAGEGALDSLLKQYRSHLLEALPDTQEVGQIAVHVGDRRVDLLQFDAADTVPLSYWHGAFGADTRYWQLLAWAPTADKAPTTEDLSTLLASFSILDEPARAALEQTLSTISVPVEVGAEWSVREQVWTHYGLQLAWTAPGPLWQIRAGEAATEHWDNAVAVMEQPRSGAYAVVTPIDDLGSLSKSHERFVNAVGTVLGKTQHTRVAGRPALTTEVESNTSVGAHWRISSFIAPNGGTMAIATYALVSSYSMARADMTAASQALTNASAIAPRRADAHRFESHRLGVGLALDGILPCTNPIPARVQSKADGISCVRGDRGVLLMAVREGTAGVGGEDVMLSTIRGMLGQALGDISGMTQLRSTGTLGGVETLRLSFGPHGDTVEADVFTKDKVMVVFMAMGMREAEREQWRSGFVFVEP